MIDDAKPKFQVNIIPNHKDSHLVFNSKDYDLNMLKDVKKKKNSLEFDCIIVLLTHLPHSDVRHICEGTYIQIEQSIISELQIIVIHQIISILHYF
jgi:hypothetical protein